MSEPRYTNDSRSVEFLGLTVTITRSAGADGALVVLVDGPDEATGDRERDEMPDGTPRVRILLNEEPVFKPVGFDPLPEPPEHLADAWQRYQTGGEVAPHELSKLDEWRDDCARDAGF